MFKSPPGDSFIDHVTRFARGEGLHARGYGARKRGALVVSKVPLPDYRPDLDEATQRHYQA